MLFLNILLQDNEKKVQRWDCERFWEGDEVCHDNRLWLSFLGLGDFWWRKLAILVDEKWFELKEIDLNKKQWIFYNRSEIIGLLLILS